MQSVYNFPRKSARQIREQIAKGLTCSIDGCNDPLTQHTGPGSDSYCRKHQRNHRDVGGYGKPGRNHTFHRSNVCECCGKDIDDDPRWELCEKMFGPLDEKQLHEVRRRNMHSDHGGIDGTRKADGGDDSEANTMTLCSFCHWYKTVAYNDGRKSELDSISN